LYNDTICRRSGLRVLRDFARCIRVYSYLSDLSRSIRVPTPSTFSALPFRVCRRTVSFSGRGAVVYDAFRRILLYYITFRRITVHYSLKNRPRARTLNPTIASNRGLRANPVRFLVCVYIYCGGGGAHRCLDKDYIVYT